ncbi:YfhO family protein [Flavobacterium longum]|uniref:YfhO family protein n=1 Tax=Flavobacterium longum TaxID=1299340 RepID=UPI0039ECEF19
MKLLQKSYPHLAAIAGFVLISLVYFYPVLQGKKMFQSDIAQYTGMAKEQNDFRLAEHAEPYWTNSAFGGMPTYQLGAQYPHDYIGKLDDMLRFLPRPADYLFLYFLGFYVLLMVLKTDPLKAFFGALAFGLSTYMIVILGVGHNAKAHAIAYMPMVIAGVLMVFKRRYIAGGLLTLFAAALEINANHFQMTYYLLLLLLPIVVYYFWKYIKAKEFKPLLTALGVFVVAGIVAIGTNAANLMATAEYTDFSMRGKSELTYNADGTKDNTTSAMKYDYITEYSYGLAESFNLIAPRLFGGGNGEELGPDSESYKYVISQGGSDAEAREFTTRLPIYWGQQPIVAAPAYIGAVVFFLFVLALFSDKRRIKWAFLAAAILSLLLSWGKNFPALTNFFIDHVPLYDKFRAVSSIQVILELCIPVLAIMGLQSFFKEEDKARQWKHLWQAGAVALGVIVLLFLGKGMFDFAGMRDDQLRGGEIGDTLLNIVKSDRKSLYSADLLRSGFLILLAFGALWLAHKDKLKQTVAVVVVGLIMVSDLFFIDKKYVKNDDRTFASALQIDQPFQPTEADMMILKDQSHYRVYDVFGRLEGRASYFHKAVGGYSAVRPRRMDQLFEYQIDKKLGEAMKSVDTATLALTRSVPVMDMLNIKYLIFQTNDGSSVPVTNPFAYGNAWFVDNVRTVASADAEMKALGETDLRKTAIVNKADVPGIQLPAPVAARDTVSSIKLDQYKSNYAKYTTSNDVRQLAVFSEMYYPKGWNAYIDGKLTPHFRANYVLRAMEIPAGKHTVEFKFEPEVVATGGTISLVSFLGAMLLLIGGVYVRRKKIASAIVVS